MTQPMEITSPLYFPAGSMLGIIRAPSYDPFGDGDRVPSHQIGPCDIPYNAMRMRLGTRSSRGKSVIDVRAPAESDVLKSDWVSLPSGLLVAVVTIPEFPKNPFTSWAPFMHFQVEEVS